MIPDNKPVFTTVFAFRMSFELNLEPEHVVSEYEEVEDDDSFLVQNSVSTGNIKYESGEHDYMDYASIDHGETIYVNAQGWRLTGESHEKSRKGL